LLRGAGFNPHRPICTALETEPPLCDVPHSKPATRAEITAVRATFQERHEEFVAQSGRVDEQMLLNGNQRSNSFFILPSLYQYVAVYDNANSACLGIVSGMKCEPVHNAPPPPSLTHPCVAYFPATQPPAQLLLSPRHQKSNAVALLKGLVAGSRHGPSAALRELASRAGIAMDAWEGQLHEMLTALLERVRAVLFQNN
jgi:hypothetical protein